MTNTTTTAPPGRPTGPAEPLLLDMHQAARALNIGERTLARYVAEGEIPHVRIGRRLLFDPADLRQWIGRKKICNSSGLVVAKQAAPA